MAWLENAINFIKGGFNDLKNIVLKNTEDLGPSFSPTKFKYGEEGYARQGFSKINPLKEGSSTKINKTTDVFSKMEKAINDPEYFIRRKTGAEFANDTLKYASANGIEDEAYNNLMRKTLEDTDFFVKMNANDTFMRNVTSKMNDKDFQQQYLKTQYNTGRFNKQYGYSAKTYDDLTDTQKTRLASDLQKQIDFVNFQYGNGMEEVGKSYNRGLITKQLGDIDSKGYKKQEAKELKKAKKIGFGEEKQAYQDFIRKTYDEGGSLINEAEFYKQTYGYDTEEINTIMKDMKNAKAISSGNPDHSGIGLWQKIKDHPRISTAMAVGTVWGVSELTEDDSL